MKSPFTFIPVNDWYATLNEIRSRRKTLTADSPEYWYVSDDNPTYPLILALLVNIESLPENFKGWETHVLDSEPLIHVIFRLGIIEILPDLLSLMKYAAVLDQNGKSTLDVAITHSAMFRSLKE